MTQSGRHDRLISIDYPTKAQDARFGTETVVWVPLDPLPGSPTIGRKFFAEVQDALPSRNESPSLGVAIAANQTRIRFRWRPDITTQMRVTLYGSSSQYDQLYSIVGGPAEIGGRKAMIEIVCEKYSS